MKQSQDCKRVLLADSQGCSVLYCEACHVAEVNIGAISVRLDIEAVQDVQSVLHRALVKLSQMQATTINSLADGEAAQLH